MTTHGRERANPSPPSREDAPSPTGSVSDRAEPKSGLRNRRTARSGLGLGTWALQNPLSVVTLLGLVLYGFLRLVYDLFYGPLGVKPEEVGLGYAETLSQSLVGILLYFIGMFVVVVPLALALLLVFLMWAVLVATIFSDIRRDPRILIFMLPVVAFIVLLLWLPDRVGQVIFIVLAGITVIEAVSWAVRRVVRRARRQGGKMTSGNTESQPVAPEAKPSLRAGAWWPHARAWWRRLGSRAGERWRRGMTITAMLRARDRITRVM